MVEHFCAIFSSVASSSAGGDDDVVAGTTIEFCLDTVREGALEGRPAGHCRRV